MREGLEPLQVTDGGSGLPRRRNFLRGSGAVAAAGVTTLAAGGLLGGVADAAMQTTAQTAPTPTADRRHAVLPLPRR